MTKKWKINTEKCGERPEVTEEWTDLDGSRRYARLRKLFYAAMCRGSNRA